MKIVSFNINGIRARYHQLQAIRDTLCPDVIALQEIKVQDDEFPHDLVESLGYHAWCYGQKSHYGVAILAKSLPQSVQYGLTVNTFTQVVGAEPVSAQRRFISADFLNTAGQLLTIINCYFPQGGNRTDLLKFPYKQNFYTTLTTYLQNKCSPKQLLLLVGDMNVAPTDLDVGIGAASAARWLRNGACGFLPEERGWLGTLMEWGLVDVFRLCHPQLPDHFSWFDYRSHGFTTEPRRGLRIDLMLATVPLAQRCKDAGIDYAIRAMERPSDHCPIWVDIDI